MPGRDFLMEEINSLGGATPATGRFERFVWTAKNRNIPFMPWRFGVTQRTVRTDYPGADDPTEQILGPNFTPFTLQGKWDDRYNPLSRLDPNDEGDRRIINSLDGKEARARLGGYARIEQKRFEDMVRRGNQVRITFENLTIIGIVTDAEFDYRREWDIGYEFTFSPHHRQPGGTFALKRSPRSVLNATQLLNEVSGLVDEVLTLHDTAPQSRLTGTIHEQVEVLLEIYVSSISDIDLSIEKRQLEPELEPNSALLRLAAIFFNLATNSVNLIDVLEADDSSEALDFESGIGQLDFDTWSRGMMDLARRIVIASQRAASELQQRAEPNALALYRPYAGESLYSVSNRFYRTAHNWRAIATRNGLDELILDGTELLVIPEVTGR